MSESIPAVRWQCPACGRFIARDAITSYDLIDPGAYYGIVSRTTGECSRCGEVENPRAVVTA